MPNVHADRIDLLLLGIDNVGAGELDVLEATCHRPARMDSNRFVQPRIVGIFVGIYSDNFAENVAVPLQKYGPSSPARTSAGRSVGRAKKPVSKPASIRQIFGNVRSGQSRQPAIHSKRAGPELGGLNPTSSVDRDRDGL